MTAVHDLGDIRLVHGLNPAIRTVALAVAFASAAIGGAANAATLYSESFESGAPGFTYSGLWHVTSNFAASGNRALGYVQDETQHSASADGNYDTESENNGLAFSPVITLGSGKAMLTLKATNMNEIGSDPDTYDRLRIGVSTDGRSLAAILASTSTQDGAAAYFAPALPDAPYTPLTIDLSAYAGQSIFLTFGFESVDSSDNRHPGARIDDITVTSVPEPATWALMIGGFGLVGGALRQRRNAFVRS